MGPLTPDVCGLDRSIVESDFSADPVNWKFVARGLALGLSLLVLALLATYLSLPRLFPGVPYGPLPPAPTIDRAAGAQPSAWPGLAAWAVFEARDPRLAGSGFVFRLPNGVPVAAVAAHSFNLAGGLDHIELSSSDFELSFDALHGPPGKPRYLGSDLTGDYLLLSVSADLPREVVLLPDERGLPQPGERIVLYPGVGAGGGARQGTILSAGSEAAWAVMDEAFAPGLMSGSPIVSLHTGRVVGMALSAGEREGHTVIGMHPIGSLVKKGLAAGERLPLAESGD